MNKRYYLLGTILLLSGCKQDITSDKVNTPLAEDISGCQTKGYELPDVITDYELVWSDEFDYEGLPDETKWDYDVGGHGWGNNELQYYTDGQNVNVSEGILTIEARKEKYEEMDYTSARLISKGKGDFLYGKFEVSAKLPTGVGTWPAIWMLPTDWKYGTWPISGEIDIMEHVGYDQDVIHGSVHTDRFNHTKKTQKSGTKHIEGASEEFHKYSVEWLPDKINFFIDDEHYFTFEPGKILGCPSYKEWPFDKEFHFLLNIAIGGNWGGAQGLDETIFPQVMEVDYVRVYQSDTVTNVKK